MDQQALIDDQIGDNVVPRTDAEKRIVHLFHYYRDAYPGLHLLDDAIRNDAYYWRHDDGPEVFVYHYKKRLYFRVSERGDAFFQNADRYDREQRVFSVDMERLDLSLFRDFKRRIWPGICKDWHRIKERADKRRAMFEEEYRRAKALYVAGGDTEKIPTVKNGVHHGCNYLPDTCHGTGYFKTWRDKEISFSISVPYQVALEIMKVMRKEKPDLPSSEQAKQTY